MSDIKLKTAEQRADEICAWKNEGLRDVVINVIREAMRDQMHVSASAVHLMGSRNVRLNDVYQIVLNTTADREEE